MNSNRPGTKALHGRLGARGEGAGGSNATPDFMQRAKDALFGILFVVHKNENDEKFWPIVEVVIDHLQDLAFPINDLFPWQVEISWFLRFLELVSAPEHYVSSWTLNRGSYLLGRYTC